MGFMGLSHWAESDEAADCHFKMTKLLKNFLNEEMKKKSNEFNTSGAQNVALFIRSGCFSKIKMSGLDFKFLLGELEKDITWAKEDKSNLFKELKNLKKSVERYKESCENGDEF